MAWERTQFLFFTLSVSRSVDCLRFWVLLHPGLLKAGLAGVLMTFRPVELGPAADQDLESVSLLLPARLAEAFIARDCLWRRGPWDGVSELSVITPRQTTALIQGPSRDNRAQVI
jgi:hypothetical protein